MSSNHARTIPGILFHVLPKMELTPMPHIKDPYCVLSSLSCSPIRYCPGPAPALGVCDEQEFSACAMSESSQRQVSS